MVFKNTDGKYYLGGVVSFGVGCARAGKYGVYARVTALRTWLDIYLPKPAGRSYLISFSFVFAGF